MQVKIGGCTFEIESFRDCQGVIFFMAVSEVDMGVIFLHFLISYIKKYDCLETGEVRTLCVK